MTASSRGSIAALCCAVVAGLIAGCSSAPLGAATSAAATSPVVTASGPAAASEVLALEGVENARDALSSSGLRLGRVFRSGSLCAATGADREAIAQRLSGGVLIDLRTADAAASCPDPVLTGVTAASDPIASDADFAGYVTDPERRAAFGVALRQIRDSVTSGRAAWVHCSAGRSRTGWTIVVLMAIVGASSSEIEAEFLRSPGASRDDLSAGLAAVATTYGKDEGGGVTGPGMRAYVHALGLTDADITALRDSLR